MGRKKLTEEQKRAMVERVKQTKLLRYGDPNYNNQDKHKKTCLERYGVEHHNQTKEAIENIRKKKQSKQVQEKYEKTMLERYGYNSVNKVPEIRNKYERTLIDHYGVSSPLKNKHIKEKQLKSLRINKTFNTSKQEENYYNYLLTKYKEEDIIRQYKDERYPYSCDFYIKPQDLFIELNLHWTHGGTSLWWK